MSSKGTATAKSVGKGKGKKEKDKWSDLELQALITGVSRYGSCRRPGIPAPWRAVTADEELAAVLSRRTKYNACKDKYRNLHASIRVVACARFTAYFA